MKTGVTGESRGTDECLEPVALMDLLHSTLTKVTSKGRTGTDVGKFYAAFGVWLLQYPSLC